VQGVKVECINACFRRCGCARAAAAAAVTAAAFERGAAACHHDKAFVRKIANDFSLLLGRFGAIPLAAPAAPKNSVESGAKRESCRCARWY
jgi:hypothetical protein